MIHEKYLMARLKAMHAYPYLATAILAMQPREREELPEGSTMGVDKFWRLYYSKKALDAAEVEFLAGDIIHEVSHLLREHHCRSEAMKANNLAWNLCFKPGTWLSEGVEIEQVAMYEREFNGNLIGVETQAGFIEATPEHPLYVRSRKHKKGLNPIVLKDPDWKQIKDIIIGDYICVPFLKEKVSTSVIDLTPFINSEKLDSRGRKTAGNRAVKQIALTPEVAWLIGLYVAEGSSSPNVRFSLSSKESGVADYICQIAKKMGSSASVSYNGSSMAVNLGLCVFGRWLKKHCGNGAGQKQIPRDILYHEDPYIRQAFLDGLVTGDGSNYIRDGKDWIVYGTISQKLAKDIILLLAQNGTGGHRGIIRKGPRKIGETFTHKELVLETVTWNPGGASITKRKLNGKEISSRNARWKADQYGVWYPVKALHSTPYQGKVYNLTTPDNTYVADSYLVHNCGDMEINDGLRQEGLKINGNVYPELIGMPENLLAEEYYEKMKNDFDEWRKSKKGKGAKANCGSGSGGEKGEWEDPDPAGSGNGEGLYAEDGIDALSADLIRRETARQIKQHMGRGTVPGGWQVWADAKLEPKIDWRRQVKALTRRVVAYIAGMKDFSMRRPKQRETAGGDIICPRMIGFQVRAAVVIDTSGSMGTEKLVQAKAEVHGLIQQVLRQMGVKNIPILTVDADVHGGVQRINSAAQIKFYGGGGTDMRIGIAEAEKVKPKPDLIICITDGDSPFPKEPLKCCTLMLCIIGEISSYAQREIPAWAKVVIVPVK